MPKAKIDRSPVNAASLTLAEWLAVLQKPERHRPLYFESYRFPTDALKEQYIASISSKSDADIRKILREFLIHGGSFGVDRGYFLDYTRDPNILQIVEQSEFARRLISQSQTWEGLTWVIDLLPDFPSEAIAAIEAYNLAHYFQLPDGRISSLSDSAEIIRTKYIETTNNHDFIESVSPRDFEFLVAAIYLRSGYTVHVTKQSRDGGFDVMATKESNANVERILIECKRTGGAVGVKVARGLMGVLEEFKATRGAIVSASGFTRPAVVFSKKTARLELIDQIAFTRRLAEAFGPRWTNRISSIITEAKAGTKAHLI